MHRVKNGDAKKQRIAVKTVDADEPGAAVGPLEITTDVDERQRAIAARQPTVFVGPLEITGPAFRAYVATTVFREGTSTVFGEDANVSIVLEEDVNVSILYGEDVDLTSIVSEKDVDVIVHGTKDALEIITERAFRAHVGTIAARWGTSSENVMVAGTGDGNGITYSGIFSLREHPRTSRLRTAMTYSGGPLASVDNGGSLLESVTSTFRLDKEMVTMTCSIDGISGEMLWVVRTDPVDPEAATEEPRKTEREFLVFSTTIGPAANHQAAKEAAQSIADNLDVNLTGLVVKGVLVDDA